jgi:hypothetical protein
MCSECPVTSCKKFQDFIPDVITSQKRHRNFGPILNGSELRKEVKDHLNGTK